MEKQIFINIYERVALITVRNNGKPTFNKQASILMQLGNKSYFKVAKGKGTNCIYLFPVDEIRGTLRLSKFGNYYGFNNIALFRRLGFQRGNKYTVTTAIYKGETIYKVSL